MATTYTSLLGLALPTTGELQGTWGDTVNNSITSLLDSAVAGTTTLSTDGDVTLSTTTGAANQARQAILLCSGARTAQRTITAPAQSKIYTVINNTTGGFAVKLVGVGPTTGVTIPAGTTAQVAWNGSDFVDVSGYINGSLTVNGNLTVKGNTTLGDATADTVTVNGTITSNLIFTDNTYDIGASGATRPRSLFLGSNLTAAGTATITGRVAIGTTVGSYKLDVYDATGANTTARFYNATATGNTDIYVNNVDNAGNFLLSRRSAGDFWLYQSGASPISFYTSSVYAGMFDSSQRFLLGYSSAPYSNARLQILASQVDSTNSGQILVADPNTLTTSGTGGGILFGGYYTGTTSTAWAAISGLKNNTTAGDYGGYLVLKTRQNGGSLTNQIILNDVGNLGQKQNPSNWQTYITAYEQVSGGVYGYAPGSTYDIGLYNGCYYDGNWRYKYSNAGACMFFSSSDTAGTNRFKWRIAPSSGAGGAGSIITWANSDQTMQIDQSGFLNIGTDVSATRQVTIGGNGQLGLVNANSVLYLGATGTGGSGGFGSNAGVGRAGDANYHIGGSVAGDLCIAAEGTKNILFGTNTSAGTTSLSMKIASNGQVTMPKQSMVIAYRANSNQTGLANNSICIFNTATVDINNNYNPSTGVFTAPVSGRYLFTATLLFTNISQGQQIDIILKTSNRDYYGAPGRLNVQVGVTWTNDYIAYGLYQLVDMNANDTAYVVVTSVSTGTIALYAGSSWSHFQATLLG